MKPSFSKSESGISSIGASYDVNKKAEITLSYDRKKYFLSKFGTIKINCSSVVSATTLNIKITDDENGRQEFTGYLAVIIQHEFHHINGILITDGSKK